MKKRLLIAGALVVCMIGLSGCVTTQEDFNRLANRVAANSRDLNALKAEINDLQAQSKLRDSELDRRLEQTRQNLPDMRLELDRMHSELQRLTNMVELSERQNIINNPEVAALKKDLKFIKLRLDRLEATLSLSPMTPSALPTTETPAIAPSAVKPGTIVTTAVKKEAVKPETAPKTPEEYYKIAQTLYKKNLYKPALKKYKEFLKKFPRSSLAPDAQFYAGECYYQQKKYEEAILEYQKVIKQYGRSQRVSNALLKQAFSFYNIGDKTSAKLLLQKLVREYPNTYSGGVAKKRLLKMK